MSSLIEGYNYDIFISYRQKDNKGDRWVSEFVENLKTELESTFKEEISVYFDINPHDGLLETHDVSESLKEKLKCLIFIPIISRTYCDPKSFAWEHEFKAFVEMASKDQFGLKVKLPNGNVASRVLPIRIYDLSNADIKLCETQLGGYFRAVEFVYAEQGVNRPLKTDDDGKSNLNKTRYRNQINKVGNAIQEIVSGLRKESIEPVFQRKDVIYMEDIAPVKEKSIIVLPFKNISSDPEQEYFSDGLTEEIITDLSYIHELLVISRSSAMTFKGSNKTIPEIAEIVNVRYVLEGSVRKAGNNLRIVAQLIDTKSDTHLWAEKYSGSLDDIFNIQENVSLSIANALKLKLTHKESEKILDHPIKNIAAYECYLNARHEILGWNLESIERARVLLHNGLNVLGENEIIFAGLALSYIYQYEGGINASKETLENAKEFIDKVYEINHKSHHYYYLLGRLERFHGNNIEALRKFQDAYRVESNDPEILLFVGFHLSLYAGKTDSVEPFVEKLLEIDPLTQLNYLLPMMYYLMKGEINQTIHFARKASQFGPIFDYFLARYLAWNNQFDEAVAVIDHFLNKKNIESYGFIIDLCCFLKYVLIGDKVNALNALSEESKSYFWNDPDYPWHIAGYYSLINENVESLKWLEQAIKRGMINFPLLKIMDPFLENIRGEQRFEKLMEQVKYKWENFEV